MQRLFNGTSILDRGNHMTEKQYCQKLFMVMLAQNIRKRGGELESCLDSRLVKNKIPKIAFSYVLSCQLLTNCMTTATE